MPESRLVVKLSSRPPSISCSRSRQWALDFMTETLYDRRRIRLLTVIDEGNREGLEIAMGVSGSSKSNFGGSVATLIVVTEVISVSRSHVSPLATG